MAKTVKPALPVTRIEGSRFRVGSESVPGKAYEVDLAETSCTCEAGQHGTQCKHVRAALAKNEREQVDESRELNRGKAGPRARRKSRLDKLGYEFGEVTSAMQKEIRRGDERAAVYWGLLLYDASTWYAWKRVLVTAAEDVGLAAPQTVAVVCGLARAWAQCKQGAYYVSPHHLTMAIMALARAPKSTEVDDLQSLTLELQKRGDKREMPEYAVDAHTKAGKERGATWAEWYDTRYSFGIPLNRYTAELTQLMPEWFSPELRDQAGRVRERE